MLGKNFFNPKTVYQYNKRKKSYIIDIALDSYSDIFDQWDNSPYRRRDIDSELFQFIYDSSREIPLKAKLNIHLHLPEESLDETKEANSLKAIHNYTEYQLRIKKLEYQRLIMSFFRYVLFGLLFLVSAYILQHFVSKIFLMKILPEGLFIGGWVLFWEAFSILFFESREIRHTLHHYERLMASPFLFLYDVSEDPEDFLNKDTPVKGKD